MNIKNIMLSERSQKHTKRATYCMTPLVGNVQNRQIHGNRKQIGSCQGLETEGNGAVTDNGYEFLWGPMTMFWN